MPQKCLKGMINHQKLNDSTSTDVVRIAARCEKQQQKMKCSYGTRLVFPHTQNWICSH